MMNDDLIWRVIAQQQAQQMQQPPPPPPQNSGNQDGIFKLIQAMAAAGG